MKSIAPQQTRAASEHAISNPTLAGIEKRWEAMPPQEQAELWMQLRDRMKVDWHQMTLQEKKAGMLFPIPTIPAPSDGSEFC
jgi:cytochrome c oxidase subunit 4